MSSPEQSANAIIFESVRLRRGGLCTLDNVNARVPRGSNTVLIGPNGAGKTSLLLCLLGQLKHEGRIDILPLADGSSPRLAYVPQQLALDPHMPLLVREFLALGADHWPLWLGSRTRVREQAGRALALVGAEHLCNARMGRLSGGESRRVLLAAALLRNPDILVLDEAEAGVDVLGEQLFWQTLDAARRSLGFTQLMVSHNLSLAAHYASHIICLNRNVQAEGPPRLCLGSAQLLRLFGLPIHLYPEQCEQETSECPECGAFSHADDVLPQTGEHETGPVRTPAGEGHNA